MRTIFESEDHIDDFRRGIAVGVRANIGEWKSALAGSDRNVVDGLSDSLAVEGIARRKSRDGAQHGGIQRCDARVNVDLPKSIAHPFVDGES